MTQPNQSEEVCSNTATCSTRLHIKGFCVYGVINGDDNVCIEANGTCTRGYVDDYLLIYKDSGFTPACNTLEDVYEYAERLV